MFNCVFISFSLPAGTQRGHIIGIFISFAVLMVIVVILVLVYRGKLCSKQINNNNLPMYLYSVFLLFYESVKQDA